MGNHLFLQKEQGQVLGLLAIGMAALALIVALSGGGPGMKVLKSERSDRGADIVLAYDHSGSMELGTYCYGCFVPDANGYPSGTRYPLPWNGTGVGTAPYHCSGVGNPVSYYTHGVTYTYKIIEAEEYSYTNNSYDPNMYTAGLTYWVLQRNGSQAPSYMGNAGALGRDTYGAYIEHHPYRNHTAAAEGMGSNCTWSDLQNGLMCLRDSWIDNYNGPFSAPEVDYTFSVPVSGTWHVWVRGQGGDGADNLMWGLQTPAGTVTLLGNVTGFNPGLVYTMNGATGTWRWKDLGTLTSLTPNTIYKLILWAGAADIAVDRIIITNDGGNPEVLAQDATFRDAVLHNTTAIDNYRSASACNPCDARFGGYPTANGTTSPICNDPSLPAAYRDRRLDVIYSDEEPNRSAVEAFKSFARRIEVQKDQIGVVSYSSEAVVSSELNCLKRLGSSCTPTVITTTVIQALDSFHAAGSTNMAQALKLSLDTLSTGTGHYGRTSATHSIVLMTDGIPNNLTSVDPVCYAQDYWPTNTGDLNVDRARDCVVYYARQARDNDVAIYTIALGVGADGELLDYVARLTGGLSWYAPRYDYLDSIFGEIYPHIHLRMLE